MTPKTAKCSWCGDIVDYLEYIDGWHVCVEMLKGGALLGDVFDTGGWMPPRPEAGEMLEMGFKLMDDGVEDDMDDGEDKIVRKW